MTNEQPKALRLADSISRMDTFTDYQREELNKAAAELRQLHEANEAFGQRQEWWNNKMFDMEEKLRRQEALLRQALDALEAHADFGIRSDKAIAAIKEHLK